MGLLAPKPKNYFESGSAILIVIILILAAALTAGFFAYKNNTFNFKPDSQKSLNFSNVVSSVKQNLGAIAFYDLTVDYLREREYQSQLGQMQKVSENAAYTTYTTSYDSDGLKVNGLLTVPKGDKPSEGWPAIVFLHGYIPPTLYKTQSNYASYVDYFARNVFVVFKIDLRGHDKSEGEASGAYYSGDYIVDTLNAYSALQNYTEVDKDSIGLWGHSMAGNVVLRSVVAKKNIPAAVIWAGAVYTYEDLAEFGIDDNSYRPPSMSTQRQKRREELRQECCL